MGGIKIATLQNLLTPHSEQKNEREKEKCSWYYQK